MKNIDKQDHYEVLELPRGARKEDVERAYPLVRAAYESRSLALYSIYDEHASETIRERIDRAYEVLSDDESRRIYDESIGIAPPAPQPPARSDADRSERAPLMQGGAHRPSAPSHPRAREYEQQLPPAQEHAHEARTIEAIDEIEDEASDDFRGARLRRTRLRAGLEIDDVSRVTKIAVRHLQAIEEERFADLPADVYVRGFVSAYARMLGLDAALVARSYMPRCMAARDTQPVRRLFNL